MKSPSHLLILWSLILLTTSCSTSTAPVTAPQQTPAVESLPSPKQVTPTQSTIKMKPSTPVPYTAAKSVCVIDAKTGNVIYEKNAHEKRAIASVQKLMTALVALDNVPLSQSITVDSRDNQIPGSQMNFEEGATYSLETLLYPLLIKSANDSAQIIARNVAGTPEAFVEKMSLKAKALGMNQTRFANPHGLTEPLDQQHSTARDVAKLAFVAQKNATIDRIIQTKTHTFKRKNGTTKSLTNTNQLLKTRTDCQGMKTGYTKAAGRCLVSKASHEGKSIIVVCLGSGDLWNTPNQVWTDSNRLLDHFLYQ